MTPTPGGEGKIKGLKRRLSPGYLRDTSHPATDRRRGGLALSQGKSPPKLRTYHVYNLEEEEGGERTGGYGLPSSTVPSSQCPVRSPLHSFWRAEFYHSISSVDLPSSIAGGRSVGKSGDTVTIAIH